MNHDKLSIPSDSNNDRRIRNVFTNPTYISEISDSLQEENMHMNRRLHVQEDLGYVSNREIIRISNVFTNPTYVSEISDNLQEENMHMNRRLHVQEDLGYVSNREIIRNSIQLPEIRRRRRKSLCRCKLLDNENKQGRLYIAYVLLITLFVMMFGSIGLSLILRNFQLKFFPDFWKIAIILATLTLLTGVYICWEDGFVGHSRRPQETLHIHIEQMQEFVANQ